MRGTGLRQQADVSPTPFRNPVAPARIRAGLASGSSPQFAVPVHEEYFDVVNERDEVTGQVTRSEVHRLNLRHRAVHVLLFNTRGELFLQQRSLTKDNWPGVWDSSSSGHLNAGEDYDACTLREVREELGVRLAILPERILRLEATPETGWEFCWVYRAPHQGPFVLQDSEVRGGGWFSPEAIDYWMTGRPDDFSSCFRVLWQGVRTLIHPPPGRGNAVQDAPAD